LGGWHIEGPLAVAGLVDRDQLKVLPRLVPSYPPPSTTTPAPTAAVTQASTRKPTAAELFAKLQRIQELQVQKEI
jgi:hypothetical protein